MKLRSGFPSTLAFASTICLLNAAGPAQTIQITKDNRSIAITATGSASAMADTATIHAGYRAYGPDAKSAYAQASRVSNAIAKALGRAGVAKDAIQSAGQSLSETPPYELEKLAPAEKAQKEFQVQQSWTVKTKAADAARVLNTAVEAGANLSGQIDWSMADEDSLQAEAAGKALSRARAIAAQMAQGLDIKLGSLIYASNVNAEARPVMMRALAQAPEVSDNPAPAALPLAIDPQKVERSATVYAVFAIE